ncbi:MAG: nicotinate (nicotinamide) nucleotide adenylyltransferase [Anaerorhabdus sp.]
MIKVGCFGGSFDPIHNGHIAVAKYIKKECDLDEIWFIPSKVTPLKTRKLADFDLRVKMINLAIEDEIGLKCVAIEDKLPIPSYTINTVNQLKKDHPSVSFYWIIGDDLVNQLSSWKDIDKLYQLIKFIVVSRDSKNIAPDSKFIYKKGININASSSMVKNGDFTILNDRVKSFVFENSLYLKDVVYNNCSEKRALHSISCKDMALYLSEDLDLCKWKVYFASIMHDICKDMSDEKLKSLIDLEVFEMIKEKKYLWHAYAAKNWLSNNMQMYDKTIIDAISAHTDGSDNTQFGKLIYLSDKLERSRTFVSEKDIALAKKDLNKAFIKVKSDIKIWEESKIVKRNI